MTSLQRSGSRVWAGLHRGRESASGLPPNADSPRRPEKWGFDLNSEHLHRHARTVDCAERPGPRHLRQVEAVPLPALPGVEDPAVEAVDRGAEVAGAFR